MINKNLIIASVLILGIIIAVVSAQTLSPSTSNITLTKEQKTALTNMGITQLSIIEYKCSGNQRCFKLSGGLNETLINIPMSVCDKYKQNTRIIQVPKTFNITNGKTITQKTFMINVTERTKTNECVRYRTPSDSEVYRIVDRALLKRINNLLTPKDATSLDTKFGERSVNLK